MDKVKKIYIDSGYNAAGSNSDFAYGLKETLLKETFEAPENTFCMVDDICVPHTWRTIRTINFM